MWARRPEVVALLVGPVLVAVLLICLVPLAVLLAYSFFRVDFVTIVKHPSLVNYARILSSPTYRALVAKALEEGALIAAICAVIGYPVAWFIAKRVKHIKSVFLTALLIPLYTGDLVRIFAWRVVLGDEGVFNSSLKSLGVIHKPIEALLFSPTATAIVLTYNYLPFMILGLWLAFEGLDDRLIEAAADLGAGPVAILRRVVLPLTAPGLFAGAMMVFALVDGDYLTPQLVGGSSGITVTSAINDLFGTAFDWPLGSAIAWTLLVVLFVLATGAVLATRKTTWSHTVLAGD